MKIRPTASVTDASTRYARTMPPRKTRIGWTPVSRFPTRAERLPGSASRAGTGESSLAEVRELVTRQIGADARSFHRLRFPCVRPAGNSPSRCGGCLSHRDRRARCLSSFCSSSRSPPAPSSASSRGTTPIRELRRPRRRSPLPKRSDARSAHHSRLRRTIKSRLNPEVATGLALTIALGLVLVGGLVLGRVRLPRANQLAARRPRRERRAMGSRPRRADLGTVARLDHASRRHGGRDRARRHPRRRRVPAPAEQMDRTVPARRDPGPERS